MLSFLSPGRVLAYRSVVFLVLLASASSSSMASGAPEDARNFVRAVVVNELAADANDHSRWMYRDDNKDPDKNTVKLVIQTSQGDLSRTIEKDGRPLTPEQQKQEDQKIDAFVEDADLRQKQKQDHERDSEK